jgi:hypothetical protein
MLLGTRRLLYRTYAEYPLFQHICTLFISIIESVQVKHGSYAVSPFIDSIKKRKKASCYFGFQVLNKLFTL